jgi:hypothetical protein
VIDDKQRCDKDFLESGFSSKKCGKVFEKRSKKLMDFILGFVFLEWVSEKVVKELEHRRFFED